MLSVEKGIRCSESYTEAETFPGLDPVKTVTYSLRCVPLTALFSLFSTPLRCYVLPLYQLVLTPQNNASIIFFFAKLPLLPKS